MSSLAKNFNLLQIGDKWHYRRRVPTALVSTFGNKKVIKYSLNTSDLKEARELRDIEEVKWNEKFKELKGGTGSQVEISLPTMTTEEVKELIRGHVASELGRFTSRLENNPPSDAEDRSSRIAEQEFVVRHLKEDSGLATQWLSLAWAKIENEGVKQNAIAKSEPSAIGYRSKKFHRIYAEDVANFIDRHDGGVALSAFQVAYVLQYDKWKDITMDFNPAHFTDQ